MIMFQDVGMEKSFANVVVVLLHNYDSFGMRPVERLLEFCVFLTEPDTVKRVREAVEGYLKDVPEHWGVSEIYSRLPAARGPDDQEGGGGAGEGEVGDGNVGT